MLFTLKKSWSLLFNYFQEKINKNYKAKRTIRHTSIKNVVKNSTLKLLRRSSHYMQIRKKFNLRLKLVKQSDDIFHHVKYGWSKFVNLFS